MPACWPDGLTIKGKSNPLTWLMRLRRCYATGEREYTHDRDVGTLGSIREELDGNPGEVRRQELIEDARLIVQAGLEN